jgi:G patch domain/KOW motif-containing protein
MAVLPDTQGTDEYDEVPVEAFGAALLAGYGWKEGSSIGRDKSKGDPKIVQRGRSSGTQGLGAGSSDKSASTVRPAVVRRSVRDLRDACLDADY